MNGGRVASMRANDASGKFCTTTVLSAGNLRAMDGVAATIPSTICAARPSAIIAALETSGLAHPGIQGLLMICLGTFSWTS